MKTWVVVIEIAPSFMPINEDIEVIVKASGITQAVERAVELFDPTKCVTVTSVSMKR